MDEFSELSRLVSATVYDGQRPGLVEVSRDSGGILARLWSEVLDGGSRQRTLSLGPDILVTKRVPTGMIGPSTRWARPSELVAEILGPVPKSMPVVTTQAPRRVSTPGNRGVSEETIRAAQALADKATTILMNSTPIKDRECGGCHGTGISRGPCLCSCLSIRSGVVDLDDHSAPTPSGPDPDSTNCQGTGEYDSDCWRCATRGTVCAPYDIQVDLGDHIRVIPGQPGELAKLSPVKSRVMPGWTSWTLSPRAIHHEIQEALNGRELFSTAGYPVYQVPEASASVTVATGEAWPDATTLATTLATKLADNLNSMVSHVSNVEGGNSLGHTLDDSGMVRGLTLIARAPLDGEETLGELLSIAESRGLAVGLSMAFIATGESGDQVTLMTPEGEPVWYSDSHYRLIDAVQGAFMELSAEG